MDKNIELSHHYKLIEQAIQYIEVNVQRQTVWSPMPQNAANRCVSWPRAALAAT